MRTVDREPKQGWLPAVIAGGAMVVCCLGLVLVVSGGSGLTAWLGGINPFNAAAIAIVVGIAVLYVRRRRLRGITKEDPDIQQSQTLKEDK